MANTPVMADVDGRAGDGELLWGLAGRAWWARAVVSAVGRTRSCPDPARPSWMLASTGAQGRGVGRVLVRAVRRAGRATGWHGGGDLRRDLRWRPEAVRVVRVRENPDWTGPRPRAYGGGAATPWMKSRPASRGSCVVPRATISNALERGAHNRKRRGWDRARRKSRGDHTGVTERRSGGNDAVCGCDAMT